MKKQYLCSTGYCTHSTTLDKCRALGGKPERVHLHTYAMFFFHKHVHSSGKDAEMTVQSMRDMLLIYRRLGLSGACAVGTIATVYALHNKVRYISGVKG